MKICSNKIRSIRTSFILCSVMLGITICCGTMLSSDIINANSPTATSSASVNVPMVCTMSSTSANLHSTEINNGQYNSNVGTTTIKASCNDNEGFAIYAIGYTDNEDHKNVLANSTLGSAYDIATGTATSGNSQWAMKLTTQTDSVSTYPLTIENNYDNYHTIPFNYEMVAKRVSATDTGPSAEGSTLTSTYQVYIAPTQATGTYTGQVKYVMVHPNNHAAPIANPAVLDTGRTVNAKLKSLAATIVNGEETTITPAFSPFTEGEYFEQYIKSIDIHLETPAPTGFVPTEANTISSSASIKPIYIVFDNTDDAGIMHFYTEGEKIILPTDSSYMLYALINLTSISGISDWVTSDVTDMSCMFLYTAAAATTFDLDLSSWDTSNVTDMSYMFTQAGYSATTFILDLSSWDTSSVVNMKKIFEHAGYSATTWSIGDLSSWDTSNVVSMDDMFNFAGYSATTFTLDLSSWDTSKVTSMYAVFNRAGYSATTWSIGDLSSWDTSRVTTMYEMFFRAGYSATVFTLDLSSWDTSNVTNMDKMFYQAGYSATDWSIGDLSSWNTSEVITMYGMFEYTGYSAANWSIGDLSFWDTSSVTNMGWMFVGAGYSATTFILDLSSWNTSKVTSMYAMFDSAGYSATTFILDLSSWNTSNVTSLSGMFDQAGDSATIWSVTIPQANGGGINNTTNRFYGKTTSVYGTSPSGKSFTLAQ